MPLRILIDARQIRNFGIGSYTRNLINALSRIDHENRYILAHRPEDASELRGLGSNFESAVYTRPENHRFEQMAFAGLLRDCKPDLTHFPLANVPWFAPRPYIVTLHDMSSFLFEARHDWRENWRLYRFRRGLLRARCVIAVSAATQRDVNTLLDIPNERIRQVYSAPDPRFYTTASSASARSAGIDAWPLERKRLLERYNINYPFLLYAGRIRPHKNIPRLVEAFAVIKGELESHPSYKDLRLIIIGDEINRHPEVRRTVIQTRVEQCVRFLGFVPFDTLRVFYAAAEAFVFPSLYEGFGLPPLEAMASGTPVVTSNVSSIPEAVHDAALLVNPESVFEISKAIRQVLLDRDLRARLVTAGAEQARRFSWDRTARAVLEVYQEIAGQR
jgi:glycosyltransferase involved in cell wall biosynthesis